ncbi:MAG: efflux RND transporter periplasmic adaptor subunit [Lachnospiraceae bacterium]|nr:efflux RND transporter periplasmic adaptor subunit [Lachnospiraceae bacterium]
MFIKKVIITLLILAVLGAGGYGAYTYFYAGTSASGTRVSSSSEDAVYVETVSSITGYGSGGSGVIDRYSGEVEAQSTLEGQLDSNRTLDECFVEVGDIVTVGQELFSYSTQDEEDQIAQNEIEIERDQMTIAANETEIASQEKLMASYTDEEDIAETSLSILRLQNENRSLEYEIQSKQLEIESLQEEIDNSVVTAEMGGIVQKISDTEDSSDYYSPSDSSAYITILAEGDYRVKGTVNELNYWDIYEGMTMIVYSRVDSSLTWTGVISEISTEQEDSDDDYYYYYSSSSDTSSYTFYVQLDSSEGLLLGQHVYMEEDAGQSEEKDGLWLSSYYIMVEDDGAYVWLANTSNVIEKHAVTLGEYDEALEEYEILDGLEADDYIAWPSEGISEGDPVYYYDIAVVSDGEDDDDWDEDLDDEDYYDADDDDSSLYYDVEDGVYYSLDGDDEEYLDDEEYYGEDAGEVYYDEEEYLDDDIYYDDDEYLDDDVYYDDDEYFDDAVYYDADEDEYVDDEEAYFDDDAESVDGNVVYYDDED